MERASFAQMPDPVGLRLALFYGAVFATIGIHLPFWPLWLDEARGLSPSAIGWVLAAGFWPRVVTNLLVPHLADRFGARRGPMIALGAATLGAIALFTLAHDLWALLLLSALVGACWAPLLPLGEALALDRMRERGLAYGPVRLWGSITFILAAIAGGQWLEASGAGIFLPLLAATVLATLLATVALPRPGVAGRPTTPPRLRHLLVEKGFMGLVLAAGLIGVSHAVYYGFATIHWRAAGHGELLIGALWAEGVVAEVVFFAWSGRVIARLGPRRLLGLSGGLTVLRWTASAVSADLWVLIPAQTLHAASFAAVHLAVMHHIRDRVAPELQASAQGVYSVVGGALLFGLLTPLAGWLYGEVGGAAFLAMAMLAAAGTGLSLTLDRASR